MRTLTGLRWYDSAAGSGKQERWPLVEQTAIVVTSVDSHRLGRLLDSNLYTYMPGVDSLRRELSRARIVSPTEIPPDVVTMNSTVRFINDSSGSDHELSLVYPNAAGSPGTVSVLAPIGSALLGLSVGQSVSWQITGGRELKLRILGIVQQPEASGVYHQRLDAL
ncbi:MAG TPA: nucleoside diphosphate kinase regulator [Woeseiaceae bacterium]|nr:nucleoside diphosphate kinase regulator [Woeseiaceae bacterium]